MDSVMDTVAALARVDGDAEFLRDLVGTFVAESVQQLHDLRCAIAACDTKTLRQVAHTIKGAAGNLAATAVFEAARRLEQIGDSAELMHAQDACAQLARELRRLEEVLPSLP